MTDTDTPKPPNWRDVALQLTLTQRQHLFLMECELTVKGWDTDAIRDMLWRSAQQWAPGNTEERHP